jgi:O-antigen/teichoic acid export membrane protein
LTTRWLALGGAIGPVMFLGVLAILDLVDNRVDLSGHELGRVPLAMHLDFLIFGLLSFGLAVGLVREVRKGRLALTGGILLSLFALGPVLCTFTLDAGSGPPSTWHGTLHFFGFLLIALALIPVVFVFAWLFRGDNKWGRYEWYSLVTGIAVIAVVFIPANGPSNTGTASASAYPLWFGPASMLELVIAFAWLELVAIRLWLLSQQRGPHREGPASVAA